MTDMPPSRYRVVERGRRLVVIDTLTGQPATREHPTDAPASTDLRTKRPVRQSQAVVEPPARNERRARRVFRTSSLYDAKGPREIVIGEKLTGMLGGGAAVAIIVSAAFVCFAITFPALLFLPLAALTQPRARQALRAAITLRLDSIAQPAA